MATPSPSTQVQFLTSLQRLLDEGVFTSTYKYALLMAIADICVEKGDESGQPLAIPLPCLAEKFIQYYWRQAVPYPAANQHRVLVQNKGTQAAIINWLAKIHPRYRHSLVHAKANEKAWNKTVLMVALKIKEMPLYRLQVIGGKPHCFLYPHDTSNDQITLYEGVAYCMRRFHGMVTRMLQGAWVDEVRRLRINQQVLGQVKDLAEFLFGSERTPLKAYQPILMEIQQGHCFYCQREMRKHTEVDHFIPWSRYPVDLGHNFVLAHAACNSSKGSVLASHVHLERWLARNATDGTVLTDIFDSAGLPHDIRASHGVTHWAYEQNALSGGLTWESKTTLETLPSNWSQLFTEDGSDDVSSCY